MFVMQGQRSVQNAGTCAAVSLLFSAADLFDREIARYFTFTQKDLDLIKSRRRLHNRLVLLCRQIKCTFLR